MYKGHTTIPKNDIPVSSVSVLSGSLIALPAALVTITVIL